MKPTLEALLALFRRHSGVWLNHAIVYEAGGHRTTARVMELRKLGHRISHDGQGESSRYRYDGPQDMHYDRFTCRCGWGGKEPQAVRTYDGFQCPHCQEVLMPVQGVLFR